MKAHASIVSMEQDKSTALHLPHEFQTTPYQSLDVRFPKMNITTIVNNYTIKMGVFLENITYCQSASKFLTSILVINSDQGFLKRYFIFLYLKGPYLQLEFGLTKSLEFKPTPGSSLHPI